MLAILSRPRRKVMYGVCFVLDSYNRRCRNRAWPLLSSQHAARHVPHWWWSKTDPVSSKQKHVHSTGNYKWSWNTQPKYGVLGITLAIINLAALYCALDLIISSLWKGSTEPHFAPPPGTCQGRQTVTRPGSDTCNSHVPMEAQGVEIETHLLLLRQL